MGRQWLRRPSPALVVSVIALVAALGGGAYATIRGIPDAKGLFHGCVNNKTGVLRVVKSANSCRHRRVILRAGKRIVIPGELAIAWNQTGPQGLAGLQGRPGTNGTNGSNGTNGTDGTNGAPGSPAASTFSSRFSEGSGVGPFFGPVSGMSTINGNTNESAVVTVSPGTTIVARDLFATYANDNGTAGSTRTFTLRVNGADSALTCNYTLPVTTCSDTTHQVTIPAGSQLAIEFTQGGASISSGNVLTGWRGTTP